MDDRLFMGVALAEAAKALAEDELPVGCVIVDDEQVIAYGRRQADAHFRFDHAEMNALRRAITPARREGQGLSLYTTLEPCVMCYGAILNSFISRVIYAVEDPYGGGLTMSVSAIPRHRGRIPDIIAGVRRDQAKTLFRKFFLTTHNVFWETNAADNPLRKLCLE